MKELRFSGKLFFLPEMWHPHKMAVFFSAKWRSHKMRFLFLGKRQS